MTPEEMQQVIAAQQAQLAQLQGQGQQGAQQPQVQAPLMPAPQPIPQTQYYPQPQPAYPLPQPPMWGATPAVQPPMPCEISIPIKLKNGDESLTIGVIQGIQDLTPEAVSRAVANLQARGFTLAIYKPKGSGGGWSK